MDAILDVAKKRELLVLSDEIYESLQYDEVPVTAVGRYDNVVLLNGFSKNAAMCGWRVGFAAGPEDVIQHMNTLQQYTFVCAPSFAQKAAVVALQADMSEKVAAYSKKRDLVCTGLQEKFALTRPGGAFYCFPEAPSGDGEAFVKRAIENNVLIIPGNVFSERNTHFRVSFAAPDETLARGIDILNGLAD
jgi:aspartate aminotransferase/aminotransferase